MLRLYSPVLILQMYCLYHAYQKKADAKWYLLIMVFPLFGGLIYLYKTHYNKHQMKEVSEGIKRVLNSTHTSQKLEKQLQLANTISNRIALADEYVRIGNLQEAYQLYVSCLVGMHRQDVKLLIRLVDISYELEKYSEAIKYGEQIREMKEFVASDSCVKLARSMIKLEMLAEARTCFESMNKRFSNYTTRIEFAQFLNEIGEKDESGKLLEELFVELKSMDRREQRKYSSIIDQANQLEIALNKQVP